VIAVDTNILIYAHRADTPWHDRAAALIVQLAQSTKPWSIPVPCIAEFMSVVTGFKGAITPTPLAHAVDQVRAWMDSPSLSVLHSGDRHVDVLMRLAEEAHLRGGQFHDARIAAICLENGVNEFWSADRDFSSFPALKTLNPLVKKA
jgi:uncharacterized protein